MNLSITRATPGDAGAIADLLGASALPLDGALACLESAVVARAEGRVVGCAALWPQIMTIGSLADLRPADEAQVRQETDEEISAR